MPNRSNTIELFWSRVDKNSDCWEYQCPRNGFDDNYPQFRYNGKYWTVSRLSWTVTFGEILDGLFVCHHCDNPKCVRPDHLFLGTSDDNNKDKAKKGRARSGGETLRKLSDNQIFQAFYSYDSGKSTLKSLSIEYGMSVSKLAKWFIRVRRKLNVSNPLARKRIDNNAVMRMRIDGKSMRNIAAHFGVSEERIARIIKEVCPELQKRIKKKTGITLARV